MNRVLHILLDLILAFFALLAFGQFYSWFWTGAVVALGIYAVLVIGVILWGHRRKKAGDEKAAARLRWLITLLLLLPTVLALGILILAFSAMAIYG